MKKRYFSSLTLLTIASALCFVSEKFFPVREWVLFLSLLGVTLLFQGLTSQRKKQKSASFFDLMQEGIVVLDWEGEILEINQKGAKLLDGLSMGQQLFSHPALEGHRALFNTLKETRIPQSGTMAGVKKVAYYELKILEPRKRILATFIDRYEHYQKEQLGRDFVANASHELRTPITIIKGFAEMINDLPEISEGMLQDFTEKILRSCERMEGLVKNLLTLADLDYLPKAKMQACNLVGLIESCSQTLLSVYPDIHIEALQNKEEIIVDGDSNLLELALMNLLENAVKYSHQESKIVVTIEDLDEAVTLKVCDEGIGISKKDLENIFERFYTANKSRSRQMDGAGLGLSIVKTIISKHDAGIEVSSSVGYGTTFTLTFKKANRLLSKLKF